MCSPVSKQRRREQHSNPATRESDDQRPEAESLGAVGSGGSSRTGRGTTPEDRRPTTSARPVTGSANMQRVESQVDQPRDSAASGQRGPTRAGSALPRARQITAGPVPAPGCRPASDYRIRTMLRASKPTSGMRAMTRPGAIRRTSSSAHRPVQRDGRRAEALTGVAQPAHRHGLGPALACLVLNAEICAFRSLNPLAREEADLVQGLPQGLETVRTTTTRRIKRRLTWG